MIFLQPFTNLLDLLLPLLAKAQYVSLLSPLAQADLEILDRVLSIIEI